MDTHKIDHSQNNVGNIHGSSIRTVGQGPVRMADRRSEQRILKNRMRRQQELKRNGLLFLMTLCLILACSFTLSTFHADAKSDADLSCKYYKSIVVSGNDTLWSIAEEYMDAEHYDSINDYIKEVKHMNSLSDDSIHYGEYIVIPYYESL